MESQAAMEQMSCEDVRKSGYLRKQKSMHRRFFVLRAASEQGPARLEYYENEKKFRSKSPVPKRAVNLDSCFNINKRADSKNKHMIVLYTRGESFAIAADTEEVQNEWYQAMLDLQGKSPDEHGSGGDCGLPSPGPAFKEVWQVKVWPKGLGQARNLVGIYRLCLTDKTVNFVKLNSDIAAVVLQLMNVRRCGHSENFFFIEVGRSAMTGPGEFWMQVEDSVVAQNMHETLLEAMKALSEEFRQRSKSQAVGVSCGGGTASNPISVPSRRHHPNFPPSQVGLSRRARTETPGAHNTHTSPTPRHGFSRSRTASIGARTEDSGGRVTAFSTSPSLNGSSCSTTPTLRPKPTRAPTPAKITLSLARYTPNPAPSPAPSLSSSSGHGSECGLGGASFGAVPICTYARIPQRVSMSGSPSDYGSSDEYGSSPGEHSLLATGVPAALVEGGANYILMGHREGSHKRVHGRRVLRRSSNRDSEVERRLLSKRASLPPTSTQERLFALRTGEEEEEEEEYAVMSRSESKESFTTRRGSGGLASTSMVQEKSANKGVSTKGGPEDSSIDSGYMSMLPGVTAPPATLSLSVSGSDAVSKDGDEYMAMTPNSSVSPPQHIRRPTNEGYMMMSPNSSCSPDLHGLSGSMWGSRGSMESRAGSDYMNMSPISARSACSTPPSHPEQQPTQPKMVYSYFSLPRSYKHSVLSTRFEDNLGEVCMGRGEAAAKVGHSGYHCGGDTPVGSGSGGKLSLSSSSFSSSSASSESLEDRSLLVGGLGRAARLSAGHRIRGAHPKVSAQHQAQQSCGLGINKQGNLTPRKDEASRYFVDMSKANTLPRVRETLLPVTAQSPGDYVSIICQGERERKNKDRTTTEPGNFMAQGHQRAFHQPQPYQGGSINLTRSFSAPLATSFSLSSEYVNMDLGSSPSSVTPLSSFKPVPKGREELGRTLQIEQNNETGLRKGSLTGLTCKDVAAAPFTEYTEMKFGLGVDTLPKSPKQGQTPLSSSMEQDYNKSLPSSKSFSSVDQVARLVRVESTARRRHRSETFTASATHPVSPSASPSAFPEISHSGPQHQHGLDTSLWSNNQPPSPQFAGSGATNLPAGQASSSTQEQGLNYIDLDLVSKENQNPLEGTPGPLSIFSPVVGGLGLGGNTTTNINTYASIDFLKSDELRIHQNRRDSKDC
ncbi:hypothetical protein DNTS_032200 [Danionella cerebrum]|uniref:PH domain-containing protein n=1 Tax=Danionella cerebrum TaxID=2873325 RepID=A0A553R3F8_9TELE|nr:hypothetical protein DNTS_032200 [Danionella translucida]